jgi:hypothetical protein
MEFQSCFADESKVSLLYVILSRIKLGESKLKPNLNHLTFGKTRKTKR